jgi:hypothetical protein
MKQNLSVAALPAVSVVANPELIHTSKPSLTIISDPFRTAGTSPPWEFHNPAEPPSGTSVSPASTPAIIGTATVRTVHWRVVELVKTERLKKEMELGEADTL